MCGGLVHEEGADIFKGAGDGKETAQTLVKHQLCAFLVTWDSGPSKAAELAGETEWVRTDQKPDVGRNSVFGLRCFWNA